MGGREECPVTEAMEHWKWGMAAKDFPFPNCKWCWNNETDINIFKTIYSGKTDYTEYYEMGRQLIIPSNNQCLLEYWTLQSGRHVTYIRENLLPLSSQYLMMAGASASQISTDITQKTLVFQSLPKEPHLTEFPINAWPTKKLQKYHPCYVAKDIDIQIFSICKNKIP